MPASVTFYVNWVDGTDTGTNYVTNTPEVPDAFTLAIQNSNIEVAAGAPWNGQPLLDVANNAVDGVETSSLTSAELAPTSARLLFEFEPWTEYFGTPALEIRDSGFNFRMRVYRMSSAPDYLRIQFQWNGGFNENFVDFSSFPSNPFALEIIYDTNNATANQRLRARFWGIGSSAPSFTNSTSTSGSAASSEQPTYMDIARYNSDTITTRLGRIIFSDDITQDLSVL